SLLRQAQQLRIQTAPPHLSNFRVLSIIAYEDSKGVRHEVIGTNAEPCHLGGSICAERAALCALRLVQDCARVTRVVVLTDSRRPLSPGLLCLEFLSSVLDPATLVVMAGCNGSDSGAGGGAGGGDGGVVCCPLSALYSFPCFYGCTPRDEQVALGRA
ncbi:unnamed protein product, partial [Phaeothamnion confervicola]